MKILIGLILGWAMVIGGGSTSWAKGENNCPYGSTQARVQKNVYDPWGQERTIKLNESFNVGSFHNHTGQFANDTHLRVDGPGGLVGNYNNGDKVIPGKPGKYVLTVTTESGSGEACTQRAVVNVEGVDSKAKRYKWKQERKENSGDDIYRRNGWWNSDGKARYGDDIYTRNGWWNSDGRAQYGKGIYNRNGWWGE